MKKIISHLCSNVRLYFWVTLAFTAIRLYLKVQRKEVSAQEKKVQQSFQAGAAVYITIVKRKRQEVKAEASNIKKEERIVLYHRHRDKQQHEAPQPDAEENVGIRLSVAEAEGWRQKKSWMWFVPDTTDSSSVLVPSSSRGQTAVREELTTSCGQTQPAAEPRASIPVLTVNGSSPGEQESVKQTGWKRKWHHPAAHKSIFS